MGLSNEPSLSLFAFVADFVYVEYVDYWWRNDIYSAIFWYS